MVAGFLLTLKFEITTFGFFWARFGHAAKILPLEPPVTI
jgi:hypothetical protein